MSCENEITINSMGSNQLKNESSLYLKQHSENPVNWQRWSNSIFDFSEELNKLVIVSIGYSSCHWCHVMEDETFELQQHLLSKIDSLTDDDKELLKELSKA